MTVLQGHEPNQRIHWAGREGREVGEGLVLLHLYSPGRHLSMPLTDVQVAPLCDKNNPSRHFQSASVL